MKKDDDPLSWEVGDWFTKWKGGKRFTYASLTLQPFFFLNNQVVRVFRLKDWLIIIRAVTYEVCGRICSQVARNQLGIHWPAIFLNMAAD